MPSYNQQTAERVKRSCHFLSLVLTLILLACIFLNGVCLHLLFTSPKDSCGDIQQDVFVGCFLFYFFYWVERCTSSSSSYLKNEVIIYEYENFIADLKRAPPQLGTRVECYHYVMPQGSVSYKDSRGRERTIPKDFEKKEVSFTGTSYFNYSSWKYVTGDVVGVIGTSLVKLEIEKVHSFANPEMEKMFKEHEEEYVKKYQNSNKYCDDSTMFDIPGHLAHVLVKNQSCVTPCCVGVRWYYFWSFFLLSWLYRIWFEIVSKSKKIKVHKVIYGHVDQEKLLRGI